MQHDDVIYLRQAGVSLAFDVSGGTVTVLHWGRDLGELSPEGLSFLRVTNTGPVLNNAPDVPRKLTVLPVEADGWAGTPALSGHIAGTATTPRLTLTTVERFTGDAGDAVVFGFEESVAGLLLDVRFQLTVEGLIETEASVRFAPRQR
jgi:alpha-galactosidase